MLRRLVILFLLFRFTTLPPLCPPIKEELPFPAARENGGPQHNSTPNILDMAEVSSTILISKSEKICGEAMLSQNFVNFCLLQ